MSPSNYDYEITEQDMLFLRALAGRKRIKVGISPSVAYTADCEASPAVGCVGNLLLLAGVIATGFLLWNREWGFAVAAVIGTGILANMWRARSAQRLRIRALFDANLFAHLWGRGLLTIGLPDGKILSHSQDIFPDLRSRFPELDAEFPNQS
jgi:hypothetical protein